MPKQFSKAKKAAITKKNEENSAKQRHDVELAKAQKQEQRRQAEEQRRQEEEKKRAEKQKAEAKERYYNTMVDLNTKKIVSAFVKRIREKIWMKKIAKITELAGSSNKKVILVQFYTEECSTRKSFYYIFEVEDKNGFQLDLSVYKNYIFTTMFSTSKLFDANDYQYILESAKCEMSNVDTILEEHFSSFDAKQVIKCISLDNSIYNNLVREFTSEFHQGVSSMLNESLRDAFETCAKSHNLGITNVSNHKGRTISAWYYQRRAKNLYTDSYNDYDSDDYSDEYLDSPQTFETGISYSNGCSQCNNKNLYAITFHIGFDPKTKRRSIVYKGNHYTVLNMDDLFTQLLKDGLIYENPICQNCCKHNEVQIEVSSIMSKLSGLMYVGEPEYRNKYPMPLNDSDSDSDYDYDYVEYEHVKKECITIKLSEESDQCNEGLSEIQIIKNRTYVKVEEPISKSDEGYYTYNTRNSYSRRYNAPRTKMVIKENTEYTARVPIFRKFVLWRPEFNVTIAFRNMQIAFMLCQSMMAIPYVISKYIFSFIIIPDMYTNTRNLEFELGKLDNFKLIEDFVNKVNFRLIQEN